MQLPVPVAVKPTKRLPANQKECIVGRNRKARKTWSRRLFDCNYASLYRQPKDPIYYKRLRRESRHDERLREALKLAGVLKW